RRGSKRAVAARLVKSTREWRAPDDFPSRHVATRRHEETVIALLRRVARRARCGRDCVHADADTERRFLFSTAAPDCSPGASGICEAGAPRRETDGGTRRRRWPPDTVTRNPRRSADDCSDAHPCSGVEYGQAERRRRNWPAGWWRR